MNRIEIENDIVKSMQLDSSIEYSFMEKNILFDVNQIKLRIKKNTALQIIYHSTEDTKLDIIIDVMEKAEGKLLEIHTGSKSKLQYKYLLDKDSHLTIEKFYDVEMIKQLDTIYLNGEKAAVDYILKTISTEKEKYDITIYHSANETKSKLKLHGVNIQEGKLIFNITGIVQKNMKDCVVKQENRIINLTDHQCIIQPNLFIDEYEVEAEHSAFIGNFKEEEIFYLLSRGIPLETARQLLIKGFLLSNFTMLEQNQKMVDDMIRHYWR